LKKEAAELEARQIEAQVAADLAEKVAAEKLAE